MAVTNMFQNLKNPKNAIEFINQRGVTDFTDLQKFNLYETGYSFLVIIRMARLLELLADQNTDYANLITSYTRILEYEFRGLSGISGLSSDTSDMTDGISTLSMITKVNKQSNISFSMSFFEKSGSVITRTHELFLRSIKDPANQFKTYAGLFDEGIVTPEEAGYDMETMAFLYIVTDNTGRRPEKAFYIAAAQPTSADYDLYNTTKGSVDFQEISVEMNGFVVTGAAINKKAADLLDWMFNTDNENRVVSNSMDDTVYKAVRELVAKPVTAYA